MWLALLLSIFTFASASEPAPQEIVGHWFFYKKVFRGSEMPEPPEATLRLHFEFYADGTNKLYWWHEGENDLCTRWGKYQWDGKDLVDEITKVDPKNHPSCSRDPDMQLGKISRTPVWIENGDMKLLLHIGDDDLIYVWKRL